MSGGRRGGGGRTVGRGVLEKDLIESSSDSDASDGCRPRKVSADVFRVFLQFNLYVQPENVNCRVESFGAIINKFDEDKQKLVKEMGFAGLYALVDRSMVTVDGKEFRFGAA
uniref:Uncharacterized protein n=1 Tax=Chenopodium quinoa TaxID=63459 RepID=A0A803MN47_CHEQI